MTPAVPERGTAPFQVLGEQGGGEWDKGHAHQEYDVQEQQAVVGALDQAEAVVVVDPDHADLQGANHVPEVGEP